MKNQSTNLPQTTEPVSAPIYSHITWLNEDLVKRGCYDKEEIVLNLSRTFTYDLSKENKLNASYLQFYPEDVFKYGQEKPYFLSKHLLTATTDMYKGQPVNVEKYTYPFNTHGCIREIFNSQQGDATELFYRITCSCD